MLLHLVIKFNICFKKIKNFFNFWNVTPKNIMPDDTFHWPVMYL